MGLLGSLWRAVKSFLGLAEGGVERATDAMVTSSPDAIRSQFRKTREDWVREYNQMRDAVADLIRIREMRRDEAKQLTEQLNQLEQKMNGAIELYKKNPDERYREAYAQLAVRAEEKRKRMQELETEVETLEKNIERYKLRLMEFQRQIENLSKEEAETIADIVSSQKIKELNDRLQGLSLDTHSKNLEAIREARQKAKATAALSSELSGADARDFDKKLEMAGAAAKYMDAFDKAVGKGSGPQTATAIPPLELEAAKDLGTGSAASIKNTTSDAVDLEIKKLLEN